MNKPYSYTQIAKNIIGDNKTFQLFCDYEPLCLFELNDVRVMNSLNDNLNAAFNLGKELGKQSIFTKESYTYGIELKNIYYLNVNETYDELLCVDIIDYDIVLPDATTHALPNMDFKTATRFVNLMNQAHNIGYSNGLSYSTNEYETSSELRM